MGESLAMLKNKNNDLTQINQEICTYLFKGYDLYFVHGWFNAYLSSPSDSEDDLVIPTYLILDEDKISDENKFAKTIDKLIAIYSELSDNIFEKNKPLRPMVDFLKPNTFDPLMLDEETKQNLLMWLYGYLTAYLVTSGDVVEYATNQKLLDEKFFPALFTLCVSLTSLSTQVSLDFMADDVKADFYETLGDIKSMWESEDDESSVEELFKNSMSELDLADIVGALNDVFYVIRVSDERRFIESQQKNGLLNKLTTRH